MSATIRLRAMPSVMCVQTAITNSVDVSSVVSEMKREACLPIMHSFVHSVAMKALLVLLLLAVTAQQHEGPSSNLVTQSALHTIRRLIQVRQNSDNYRIASFDRTLSTT